MQTYEQALQQGKEFLLEHDDFLIVSHVQPDGDAVSSTVMVGWLLSCLGKKFTMINEGPIPPRMHYMWGASHILNGTLEQPSKPYQYVVCVDCADYERVGRVKHWFTEEKQILNIDHHPTNNGYGEVNIIKDDAAATAEILYDLVEHMGLPWDKDAATAAYTGILTDTGGFRYANTSPKVMAIASALLSHGVNGPELAELLLEQMTLPQLKVLTKALDTLHLSEDRKIAWVVVTPQDMEECGAANDDLEGIVNYPRNIQGVEVGIFFKIITDDVVKVSFRSGGTVDVASLAKEFGGGGHIRAAGARVEGPWTETVEQVVERVKKEL
ncbi:bifunctional oligoribonuclease/PAP phosphatase NrnA [Paenibacillus sp. Marseille-Q4541]|uniref:DHH family phosphoesterase n=1 Tax=Paenibacillus sp. Marseille-Q4541 TaxID=2831522 RepID=UPI001BA81094|nr:bifunctional oligoribonuclease/PAP phosphatase NrnA [Paenibacillus sp. Marseille-Q4541]